MDDSRRKFVKGVLALGALAAAGGCMHASEKPARWISGGPDPDPVNGSKVKFVRTVCLGCHSADGLQCKVVDGVLVKIDGNPYHPNVMEPHIAYKNDPKAAERVNGTVCAKGGATMQTLYDPFRLQHPVNRVGPRGSGQWKTITWNRSVSTSASRWACRAMARTALVPVTRCWSPGIGTKRWWPMSLMVIKKTPQCPGPPRRRESRTSWTGAAASRTTARPIRVTTPIMPTRKSV